MALTTTNVATSDTSSAAVARSVRAIKRAVTPFFATPADARLFHAWRP